MQIENREKLQIANWGNKNKTANTKLTNNEGHLYTNRVQYLEVLIQFKGYN